MFGMLIVPDSDIFSISITNESGIKQESLKEVKTMIFNMTTQEEMEFIIYMLNEVNSRKIKNDMQLKAVNRVRNRLKILRTVVNKKSLFRVLDN